MSQRPSRHQMRRHVSKMRRYGLQPMTIINPGDPLPEIAIVTIGRWVWRYRSELAPFAVAFATAAVAWWLHEHDAHWWPLVAALAVASIPVLMMAGARLGLADLLERLYASTVATSIGGWLAAATAASPAQRPLPLLILVGTLVLAVPWWAHRRRCLRVRVERKLAGWPETSQAVGLAGSRVLSAVVDVWGWRARFALARGQTITDVITKLPAIESALGTHRGAVRVYPTPDDLANRFELRVLDRDPHADAITWPGSSTTSISEPIDLGPFEDATPCKVLFLRRHALLGGVSGSGKSGLLNVLMGNLSACTDVVIWAIDLKRGMELAPWAPCIARLATTPAEARALLADANTILEARAAHLAASGQRVWEPSPEMPALIVLVDEYAELAETAPEATADADSIARRGRAVAVTLIAATQRPTQKAMGQGALRSQMDVRICCRVRERKDVDLILGQGMLAAGWHAHTLNAPGKFLISGPEHDTPRRARAYLVTDEAVTAAATHYADYRPALDDASQRGLTERTDSAEASINIRTTAPPDTTHAPEAILWAVLSIAPDNGITVPQLMGETGMSRPWVYQRLQELVRTGQVTQVTRGRWRAATDHAQ
jgi:S-DNA-T family DNA segregation ATPase FtsK/SpoIIIE